MFKIGDKVQRIEEAQSSHWSSAYYVVTDVTKYKYSSNPQEIIKVNGDFYLAKGFRYASPLDLISDRLADV